MTAVAMHISPRAGSGTLKGDSRFRSGLTGTMEVKLRSASQDGAFPLMKNPSVINGSSRRQFVIKETVHR